MVRFSEVGNNQCRWIYGAATGDPLCCGKTVHKYSSWCKEHHAKALVSPSQRRKVKWKVWK